MHKTFTGVFLLIAMAVVGLGLVWLPGWVIDNYQAAAGVGKIWGVLYLIVVGIGTLLFWAAPAGHCGNFSVLQLPKNAV